MNTKERYCRLARDGQSATLFLVGTWQLAHLDRIDAALAAEDLPASRVTLDGAGLHTLDTAAALALLRRMAAAGTTMEQLANFKETHAEVIDAVRTRMDESAIDPVQRRWGALAALGERAFEFRDLVAGHLDFLGRSACELASVVLCPRTLRLKALTAQFEQACLNAIPVVVLVTFLMGVVLAYLLGLQTEKYGANIYVVDGVAIGTCRELAPIMVAVMVAGRSGA